MDEEGSDCFKVHRAPSGKFYLTRQADAICARSGSLAYFETQRQALEFLFLAEIGDIVLHCDGAPLAKVLARSGNGVGEDKPDVASEESSALGDLNPKPDLILRIHRQRNVSHRRPRASTVHL